jgi:1,2-phenylacetyl-CoA epoxidase catalytic subunit
VDEQDPHSLTETAFLDEVHSFEFWFGAVEGYLSDRPYGRSPETVDVDLGDAQRERLITTLCNYCVGETAALEGASGLVGFAPNRNAKIFMATQVVDEARHLEVFRRRLEDLGVDDPESEIERRANPVLLDFRAALLRHVGERDWDAAVFAQNVILETMEYTVFRAHLENADPVTAEILQGVISDERRHLGFGESDLGRRLAEDPSTRARLREVKRDLDSMVLGVFAGTLDDLAIPRADRPELGREYLMSIERLGLTQ